MEVWIGSGQAVHPPPVEVFINLSIWEAETLAVLFSRLSVESIRQILRSEGFEGANPLSQQVYGITSEIYHALSKDDRIDTIGE